MHVLHVLSQTHLTGAEVYAARLAREQRVRGHLVMLVSDTLSVELAPGIEHLALPIDDRRPLARLRNVRALARIVRERRVDIVHAHSRASSWVAGRAARLGGVGFVSTVHGRQHVHASSRRSNPYGRRIIVVCAHLADHLVEELGIPRPFVRMIPNAL